MSNMASTNMNTNTILFCLGSYMVLYLLWLARVYIDGSVQDCSIFSALAMEILQSCTKPSISPMGWSNFRIVDLTLALLKVFMRYENTFAFISIIFQQRHCTADEIFLMEYMDFVSCNQFHSCWWPGDARSQGISIHDIDAVFLE